MVTTLVNTLRYVNRQHHTDSNVIKSTRQKDKVRLSTAKALDTVATRLTALLGTT